MKSFVEKFLSWKYDRLFDKASRLIEKYNPCEFEDGVCRHRRKEYAGLDSRIKYNSCCGKCEHLTNTGCSVQCLGCRTYVCGAVWDRNPKLASKLEAIAEKGRRYHLIECFMSKGELFYKLRKAGMFEQEKSLIKLLYCGELKPFIEYLYDQAKWMYTYYIILKYKRLRGLIEYINHK